MLELALLVAALRKCVVWVLALFNHELAVGNNYHLFMSPYLDNLYLARAVWGYAPERLVLLGLVALGVYAAYAGTVLDFGEVFVAFLDLAGLWVIDGGFF